MEARGLVDVDAGCRHAKFPFGMLLLARCQRTLLEAVGGAAGFEHRLSLDQELVVRVARCVEEFGGLLTEIKLGMGTAQPCFVLDEACGAGRGSLVRDFIILDPLAGDHHVLIGDAHMSGGCVARAFCLNGVCRQHDRAIFIGDLRAGQISCLFRDLRLGIQAYRCRNARSHQHSETDI